MNIILISGKIDSGKTTLANFIEEELLKHKLTVRRDYFARLIKDYVSEDFELLASVLNAKTHRMKELLISIMDSIGSTPATQQLVQEINQLQIEKGNWYEEKTDITRTILQEYGNSIKKRVDDNFWCNLLKNNTLKCKEDILIIMDARYLNEISFGDDTENTIYKVRLTSSINTFNSKHSSETGLDSYEGWSFVIDNKNRDLHKLRDSAKIVVKTILKGL